MNKVLRVHKMHIAQMAFLERFFGSCMGTSIGMQGRDRCLRLRRGGRLES